jgi:hypothetical protein
MATSSDRIHNLLLARSVSAISLANTLLSMADPCGAAANRIAPISAYAIREGIREVEAETCALMLKSGVSWDAIATRYQVSRQSLHRRVAFLADERLNRANDSVGYNEGNLHYYLRSAVESAVHLQDSVDAELVEGIDIWNNRRLRHGWWRLSYDELDLWCPGD